MLPTSSDMLYNERGKLNFQINSILRKLAFLCVKILWFIKDIKIQIFKKQFTHQKTVVVEMVEKTAISNLKILCYNEIKQFFALLYFLEGRNLNMRIGYHRSDYNAIYLLVNPQLHT